MIFEIRILKGGLLLPPYMERSIHTKRKMPAPPKPPTAPSINKLTIQSAAFHFPDLEMSVRQARKVFDNITNSISSWTPRISSDTISSADKIDPNAFYWKNGRASEFATEWEFTCKEFRHKQEAKNFQYMIELNELEKSSRMVFQISASGRNLPEPYKQVFVVDFEVKSESVFDEVRMK